MNRSDAPRLALVTAAAFAVLASVGLWCHELWRDELEIWLIARDSTSLPNLIANLRTEAHPGLWYVLTYFAASVWKNPASMQILHLAIGTISVYLVMRFAPFSRLQRLLFSFGYFSLFEYTVISRHYGLQYFFGFAYCILYHRRRERPWLLGLLLALCANSTLYGAIYASCLVIPPLLEDLDLRRIRRHTAIIVGVAFVGVVGSLAQVYFETLNVGADHYEGAKLVLTFEEVSSAIGTIHRGFLPIPVFSGVRFWNTNWVDLIPGRAGQLLDLSLGLLCLVGSVLLLLRRPAVGLCFFVGTLLMLSITFFFWHGQVRHHAQIFMFLITCYWLSEQVDLSSQEKGAQTLWLGPGGLRRASDIFHPWAMRVLTVLLVAQVGVGGYALAIEIRHPFSAGKAAADFIRKEESLRELIVAASTDYAAQSVAAYLDRPIWHPECRSFETFVDWSEKRETVTVRQALRRAVALMDREQQPVVLLLSALPNAPEVGERIWIGESAYGILLAAFEDTIVEDENFFVLLLGRKEEF